MKPRFLHEWQLSPAEAAEIQRGLAGRVSTRDRIGSVRLVAGVDISISRHSPIARGAVVVLSYPDLQLIETRTVERKVDFPYVPGLLSFREAPIILDACQQLSHTPDLILVDGQGIAHPRRFGLASHLGVLWDRPTIGCAKSRLCGEHGPVGTDRGDSAILVDGDEEIGNVLRTRTSVKPMYISIGHRISLETATKWALECTRGYRLPEPTRLAHHAAGGRLATEK